MRENNVHAYAEHVSCRPLFIAHRVNSIAELALVSIEYGCEIDLRDHGGQLVLQHDPFLDGELFEDFLAQYRHKTLILNIKSERIEWRVLELINKYGIHDYFFLDSSFPMCVQLWQKGERAWAIRVSEYEGLDTAERMAGKAEWVWIDCFTQFPLDSVAYEKLRQWGYKLCLVSPDLQGRPDAVAAMKQQISDLGMAMDAVCAKKEQQSLWLS